MVLPSPEPETFFFGDDPPPLESRLVRVGVDGSVEELGLSAGCSAPSRGSGQSRVFQVHRVAFQRDGGAILTGDLPLLDQGAGSCEHFVLWRILPSGALDPGFRKMATAELTAADGRPSLRKVLVLEDGRLLIGGAFTAVQGQPRRNLARLRPDGSLE
jgi:hypothetical protein